MKKLLFSAVALLILLAAACSPGDNAKKSPAQSETPAMAKNQGQAVKGQPAPDFTLSDLSGKSHKLSDYRGKVVILNFWATWCPPCKEEIPSMMVLNKSMQGKPFAMLCASIDEGGKQAVTEYFKSSGNSLPVLLDTDHSVAQLYGTTGVPETFVISPAGVILEKAIGAINWSDPAVIKFINEAMPH